MKSFILTTMDLVSYTMNFKKIYTIIQLYIITLLKEFDSIG